MDSSSVASTNRGSEVAASCSATSFVSNGAGAISHQSQAVPRRFLTISDYEKLVKARKSGEGSVMWWPCAEELACKKPPLESQQIDFDMETSSDVGTHVTDSSELTSSHVTEVSELPSSASAAAFAAAQVAVDGGKTETPSPSVLSEMQRLRQENLRLVAEMDKMRKSRGEFSEASTDCSTLFPGSDHCHDSVLSDEDKICHDLDVVDNNADGSNSGPMKSSPGVKMREWIRAYAMKKNDALKKESCKDRGFLSCAPRPSRAPFASSVSQLLGQPDPGLELVYDPQVGERLEGVVKLTLRASELMDSPEVQKLRRGVVLRVEELGKANRNRVKVSLDDGTKGWISILDKKVHRPLLGKRKSVLLSDSDGEGVE